MMRQERERNPNFSPPVNRPAVRGGGAASRAPQTTNDVVYLSRDEQRAAAAKREEDAAWRLAREPIAEFHGKAQKGEPFPPSACRELLNALSEPPFAEGRSRQTRGKPRDGGRSAQVDEASGRGGGRDGARGDQPAVSSALARRVRAGGGAGSTGAFIAGVHVGRQVTLGGARDAGQGRHHGGGESAGVSSSCGNKGGETQR